MLKRRRSTAGLSLFGVLLALALFAVLAAAGMEWLEERGRERLQRIAGAQAAALSEAVTAWIESDFDSRVAAAPEQVTLATIRADGVLAPGFAPNGRDALGRTYRILTRSPAAGTLDVLVTQNVGAGDELHPVNAVLGVGGRVRIGVVDPTTALLRGPAIGADLADFRTDFTGAAPARAIGVLTRHDRETVFGDFLYRRRIAGLASGNTMETALDMGGNDITGAGDIEAATLDLDQDLAVGGSLTVTADLVIGGAATVNGAATVSGEVRADSARVTGAMRADTAAVTGLIRAARAVATGQVRAGSIGTGGALTAGSATSTGPVVAGSVAAARATVSGRVLAGSARAGSLTATTANVSGNASVTGSLTAGSVRATTSVSASSAGFSTLVVGNCIGC